MTIGPLCAVRDMFHRRAPFSPDVFGTVGERTLFVPATVGSRDNSRRGRGLEEMIGTPSCTRLTARGNMCEYVPHVF